MNSQFVPTYTARKASLLTAFIAGSFVRLVHPLVGEYPLNDGGLFYAMIQDLQGAAGLLPWFTSYNHSQIPYTYPPLAFLLTGWFAALTRLPLIGLLRLLPPLLSCLTIPAFYLLARRVLPSPRAASLATFGFALLPTAFDPLIVGAGLTRSFGLLFTLLTLTQLHSLYTTPGKRPLLLSALFASLTVLSHPGMAWFALYSSLVFLAFHYQRGNSSLRNSILAAAGTLILTAPWWGTLIARHGFDVLLSPYQTERFSLAALLTPFSLLFTNEPLVDFLAVLAFFGLLACLRERRFFLPAWLLAVFVFEPRLGAAYAAVPAALLTGIGIEATLIPAVERQGRLKTVTGLSLGFLLIYTLTSAYLAPQYQRLSPEQNEAMRWVQQHTPPEASFLVLTGAPSYGTDYTAEWFPALSERASLITPQGHEWLPGGEFNRRAWLHAELQACAGADLACLSDWTMQNAAAPTYLYISKKALAENGADATRLIASLNAIAAPLFENTAAVVYPWEPTD